MRNPTYLSALSECRAIAGMEQVTNMHALDLFAETGNLRHADRALSTTAQKRFGDDTMTDNEFPLLDRDAAKQLMHDNPDMISSSDAAKLLGYKNRGSLNSIRRQSKLAPKPKYRYYMSQGGIAYMYDRRDILRYIEIRERGQDIKMEAPKEPIEDGLINVAQIVKEFGFDNRQQFYNLQKMRPNCPKPVHHDSYRNLYRRREIAAWLFSDPNLIGNSGGSFDHRLAMHFITGRENPNTLNYGVGKYHFEDQRSGRKPVDRVSEA